MNKNTVLYREVTLGSTLVGYLSHYRDGKNIFVFDDTYRDMGPERPTFSLSINSLIDEDLTRQRLAEPQVSHHALPNFFHNLLPEGGLRELLVSHLKINNDDEFTLLSALAQDLPGNIHLLPATDVPSHAKRHGEQENEVLAVEPGLKFSLAGVQLKFSMLKKGEHFTTQQHDTIGDWIVKTPSVIHAQLPQVEYSMMKLAEAAGVVIPEIKLVALDKLENLPNINLPQEEFAYAIKRFDRQTDNRRIHIEDFAQVLNVSSRRKYDASNYDTIGRVLLNATKQGMQDARQFVRRLAVNVLLANTDAHLKNWSVYYPDGRTPELSPAYDIITSLTYINDHSAALNMARVKDFYQIDTKIWQRLSERIGLPADALDNELQETVSLARQHWPSLLSELPIPRAVLEALRIHWRQLQAPLKFM